MNQDRDEKMQGQDKQGQGQGQQGGNRPDMADRDKPDTTERIQPDRNRGNQKPEGDRPAGSQQPKF